KPAISMKQDLLYKRAIDCYSLFMKILVIEDNFEFALGLRHILTEHQVDICCTLQQAENENLKSYDIFIVDLNLPDGNGLDIIQYIREFTGHPILIISGCNEESTIIEGYRKGIDDYIVKPILPNILQEKINAIGRNRGLQNTSIVFQGTYCLDVEKRTINDLPLTGTETAILRSLFLSDSNYISYECLTRNLSREFPVSSLSSRMTELKKKISEIGLCITGRKNTGYSLERVNNESS
uniref:response regulator transcription factor n=3 Tax=uncultured Faecalibaculum sp. TaxID=1729681 RepID=UPI002711F520